MNIEEAIETIRGFENLIYTDDLEEMEKIDRDNQAIDIAINALDSADKYKWHDLRKNPNDLPTEYATVEVVLSTVKIVDIAVYCKERGFRPWYAEVFQDCPEEWKHKVMAWRYVEPFVSEVGE